jgi:hypothetical protein
MNKRPLPTFKLFWVPIAIGCSVGGGIGLLAWSLDATGGVGAILGGLTVGAIVGEFVGVALITEDS